MPFKTDKRVKARITDFLKLANNVNEFIAYCQVLQNSWANINKDVSLKDEDLTPYFKELWNNDNL